VGSAENAARALDLFGQLRDEDDAHEDPTFRGFDLSLQDGPGSGALWIHDDDAGDVENVINFVIRLAEDLGLSGLWGFEYSLSCSRPRLDGFGGGAHVIDLSARKSIGWTSTSEWLEIALTGEDPDA
jgi:hypothetical protein